MAAEEEFPQLAVQGSQLHNALVGQRPRDRRSFRFLSANGAGCQALRSLEFEPRKRPVGQSGGRNRRGLSQVEWCGSAALRDGLRVQMKLQLQLHARPDRQPRVMTKFSNHVVSSCSPMGCHGG